MRRIILIAHDLRSSHNVGSLLRTAEGIGIEKVYFTGYTPYPVKQGDTRLPHVSAKTSRDIQKTALGAETSQQWEQWEDIVSLLSKLETEGFTLAALEQTPQAIPINKFKAPESIALLLGNEVSGIPEKLLNVMKIHLIIPMAGKKESLNVVQAAAMALYSLRFIN